MCVDFMAIKTLHFDRVSQCMPFLELQTMHKEQFLHNKHSNMYYSTINYKNTNIDKTCCDSDLSPRKNFDHEQSKNLYR